jgi:uncharacterized protein YbjT (DUF2867 family)
VVQAQGKSTWQSSNRIVLVTGGTGKQGAATVRHLLASGLLKVRVLTRNPHSEKAKRLAAQGEVLQIQGCCVVT